MSIKRIGMLDGWRALSILLVLAGHLFPMGPKSWAMNGPVATTGMAIFFTLSGFLIVQFLLNRPDVPEFLRRRLFRIVPLAWSAMLILAIAGQADLATTASNLLFVANFPPPDLLKGGGHLWSLCVEVQFYFATAALVAIFGLRGLYALPVLAMAVTLLRISTGTYTNIVTWFRVDEILAGATLALLYASPRFATWAKRLPQVLPVLLLALILAAAHPATGPLNYARPYLAAAAIGISLFSAPALMKYVFTSRAAAYVALISYALYVYHGMLSETWLGKGDTVERYLKRPLLLVATFAISHLSTFWFEQPMIAIGKKMGQRRL